MLTVSDIIDKLGGSSAVSRQTGIPLTTIEGWKTANYVPVWRRADLIEASNRIGQPLSNDAFPPVSARRSRSEASAVRAA